MTFLNENCVFFVFFFIENDLFPYLNLITGT